MRHDVSADETEGNMTRTRLDDDFGSAWIAETGTTPIRNSGDLRSVAHTNGTGVYDLTWNTPCNQLDGVIAIPFVVFSVLGTGVVDFSCSLAGINASRNGVRVTTFVAGVQQDAAFMIS